MRAASRLVARSVAVVAVVGATALLGSPAGATEATGTVTSEPGAVVNEVRLTFDHDGDPASPAATVTGSLRFSYPEGSDKCVLAVVATLTGTITDDRGELSGTADVTTTYKDARNDALCALQQGEPVATEPWSATWVGTLITGDLGDYRFELQAPERASGGGPPPPAVTTTTTTGAGVNRPPRIDALSCSPNPATTTDEIVCRVTATDPDGEPLFYDWTVDGQAQLAETAGTVWTDPPVGTHTITVTVYEFLGESVTRSVTVTVNPAGTADSVVAPTEAATVTPDATVDTTVTTTTEPASGPVVVPDTTVTVTSPSTSSAVAAPPPAGGPTARAAEPAGNDGGFDAGQVGATSAALALSALVVLAGSGVGPGAAAQAPHVQGALDDPARSASLLQRRRPSTELTPEQRRALRQPALEGLAAEAARDLVAPKVDRALAAVHKKLWGASAPAIPLKVTTDLVTGMKDRERRAPLALRYWLLKRGSPLLIVTDIVGERRVRRALSWLARRLGLNRPRRR